MLISVYSDGSSSGRLQGPGGFGWVVLVDGRPVMANYGGEPLTTNNRMEMLGAIKGLEYVRDVLRKNSAYSDGLVELVSDSQYVLGIASGSYMATKNMDLVEPLKELYSVLRVRGRWVKGHSGDPNNERCDSLAKLGKKEAKHV